MTESTQSSTPALTPRQILTHPVHFLSFGFGSGLLPWVPGTWGTVAAVPIYLLIYHLPLLAYGLVVIVTFAFGVWICDVTEKAVGIPDYSGIVWDEIVGYLATMLAAPRGWWWIFVGFLLFRLFDIWKPWPIRWIDSKLKGGIGVMLDDLIAAVFAWVVLQLLARFIM